MAVRMSDFDEEIVTKQYLLDQLVLARQTNDILTENNRRLEQLLIKCIKDLQDASYLMDDLSNATDQLVAKVIKQ